MSATEPMSRKEVNEMKGRVVTCLVGLLLTAVVSPRGIAWGLEVGEMAPDFTLPSTTGEKTTLSAFRGEKMVLLEFYGADFSPV